jgi:hypothetical protein
MSAATTYAIRRAYDKDADKREVANTRIQQVAADWPLATPDRPTAHTHGDPLSPMRWPRPATAARRGR